MFQEVWERFALAPSGMQIESVAHLWCEIMIKKTQKLKLKFS